jgi:hypothetical protein
VPRGRAGTLPALLAIAAPSAACLPDAPGAPTFQEDVMPILAASCVRCHGVPATGGAPSSLRLDGYADLAGADGAIAAGAGAVAARIAARVADAERPMPPRFGLDEVQVETLARWAALAAPGAAPPRGPGRRGNRAPTVAVEGVVSRPGGGVVLTVRVSDADGDVVAGELRAVVGGADRPIGGLRSGLMEVPWPAAGVPPGAYPLSARLDDGAELIAQPLGQVTLAAGADGAPRAADPDGAAGAP